VFECIKTKAHSCHPNLFALVSGRRPHRNSPNFFQINSLLLAVADGQVGFPGLISRHREVLEGLSRFWWFSDMSGRSRWIEMEVVGGFLTFDLDSAMLRFSFLFRVKGFPGRFSFGGLRMGPDPE